MIKQKILCPSCGGQRTRVCSTYKLRSTNSTRRRHLCHDCGHHWNLWDGVQPQVVLGAGIPCPSCGNEKSVVRSTYRSKSCDGVKRHRICRHCSHMWSAWEGEIPNPRVYSKRKIPSTLTEQQIRMVLTDRTMTQVELGRRINKSRSTVQRIQSGQLYANVAPELPRLHRRSTLSCASCCHCTGRSCRMGVPDFIDEGKSFASDCDLYIRK